MQTLKIVIPMAGFGTRLRPQTWSRPKQLLSIAGKTVIEHVLDQFNTLPAEVEVEYIFIVGYLGEKIEAFMNARYPHLNVRYVVQSEMRGQSHAIYLAKDYLHGPMLMVFADTLIETDLSALGADEIGGIAWVKPVPDPRRFGVAEVGADGLVTRLIEKPAEMHNNLAVVGFYYFREAEALIEAIETQMARGQQLKGEFFLADAVNIMLEGGLRMRTQRVETWLDAGTPQAVLETNRYLLDHGAGNAADFSARGVAVIPPVYIHPEAEITAAVIGPHVSIGADCRIENAVIADSILEDGAQVANAVLAHSLVGQRATVRGKAAEINLGDDALAG